MRVLLPIILLSLTVAAGCVDWQAAYDHAARKDCGRILNVEERRACLTSVEANTRTRRAEQRRAATD